MPKGYGYGGESTIEKKGAAPKMKGSWMSKHSSSALHMGHSPVKMENVIDRDAKSSGKNQYDKYGK